MSIPRLLRSAPRLVFIKPPSLRSFSAPPRFLFPHAILIPISQSRAFASKKSDKGGKLGKRKSSVAADEEEDQDEEPVVLSFNETQLEKRMGDYVERFRKELANMRMGRANPAMLDSVVVTVDTSRVPLSDLAQVAVKDPQTFLVNVHDPEVVTAVEKAIRETNLGLNPIIDGNTLKVPVPKQTKEFRENLVKLAAKAAENTKVRVRAARQEGMRDLKKDLKAGQSSDKIDKLGKQVQTLTDKYVKDVDDVLKSKTKEIIS